MKSSRWLCTALLALLLAHLPGALAQTPAAQQTQLEEEALQAWGDRRFDTAVQLWKQLVAAAPQERSYRLGLARTLVAAGRVTEARAALDAARALPSRGASDDYNTLVAEGEVLHAERRERDAQSAFAAADDLIGRDERGRARATRAGSSDRPWRLNTGVILDHYDNARGSENQQLVELGYRFSPDLSVFALVERHHRFDTVDEVYLAGVALRPLDALALRVNLGTSPDASFRPRTEGSVKLEWLATDLAHPQLGYQLLDYPEGQITTITPGLRVFLGATTHVELQYGFTEEIDGTHSHVGAARVDFRATPSLLPSLNFQRGEEALPPQTRASFTRAGAGLTWLLSQAWHLRLDYAWEDRERAYTAQSFALGAGLNF